MIVNFHFEKPQRREPQLRAEPRHKEHVRINTVHLSPFSLLVLMKFETAAAPATAAVELWSVSTKEKSF